MDHNDSRKRSLAFGQKKHSRQTDILRCVEKSNLMVVCVLQCDALQDTGLTARELSD
jgi:hypothetical protein